MTVNTGTMSLSKAMKYKNRVVQKLNKIASEIQSNNSINTINPREVDVKALMSQHQDIFNHLIDLKALIHEATMPIQKNLFKIIELKSKIAFLSGINTTHGAQESYSDKVANYDAAFRKADLDAMISAAEVEIDNLQDHVDAFNATTKISIKPLV